MKSKVLVLLIVLLLYPLGVSAVQYPQYCGPASCGTMCCVPDYGGSTQSVSVFGTFQTADDMYQSRMNSYLAADPYADESACMASVPRRAARPGSGGTGLIPNSTPIGDDLLPLLLMLLLYTLFRHPGILHFEGDV